jgi:hypothetical protein
MALSESTASSASMRRSVVPGKVVCAMRVMKERARLNSGQMFVGHGFSRAKRCEKLGGFSRWTTR